MDCELVVLLGFDGEMLFEKSTSPNPSAKTFK